MLLNKRIYTPQLPDFEVWLYYHKESQKPNFENIDVPSE